MAGYPATPKPSTIALTARWNTVISKFDSGKEQRRTKQTQDLYDVNLTYAAMSLANFTTLWAYYQACKGSYTSFFFFDLVSAAHVAVYTGLGDGTTDTFDLPGKDTISHYIYLNGALQTATDYTILTGGGTDNADRVQFDTAPTAGYIITASFTGYLRIKCRFKDDKLTREAFTAKLFHTGLELVGLPV
jgi:hypothetical protein